VALSPGFSLVITLCSAIVQQARVGGRVGRVQGARVLCSVAMTIALVVLQVPSYITPLAISPAAFAVTGYDAFFSSETAYLQFARSAGGSGNFQVFIGNTGTTTWTRGTGTQVNLAVCLSDGTCNVASPHADWNSGWLSTTAYATTTETSVAPGDIATFSWNVTVPADTTENLYSFYFGVVLAATGEKIIDPVYRETVRVTDGTVYTVTSTADDGAGTLRAAITAANASPGKDTVLFNIDGTPSISVSSALPTITSPLAIDASVLRETAAAPSVELNGAGAGTIANGLTLTSNSGGSVIRGLVINRFGGWGIQATAGGGSLIANNYVGTDMTGTIARGNGLSIVAATGGGIHVLTPGYRIGTADLADGNLISGNLGHAGIEIGSGDAPGTTVRNNLIGESTSGSALPNAGVGVWVRSPNATVQSNLIANSPGIGLTIEANNGIYADNAIRNNTAEGVVMSGSGNAFDRNLIRSNARGGVVMGAIGRTTRNNTFRDNTVENNGQHGFRLLGPAGQPTRVTNANAIRRGSISGHSTAGILLEAGANNSISPPTVETVDANSTTGILTVSGDAEPNAEVDLYVSDAEDGEGLLYVGTAIGSDGSGAWSKASWIFADMMPIIISLQEGGQVVRATQTDTAANTSEFSSSSSAAGTISGTAGCIRAGEIEGTIFVALPGATVELYSGTSLVATTTAGESLADYTFSDIAPGEYTVRYVSGYTVCGGPLTLSSEGSTVGRAEAPIDLHNHAWPQAYEVHPTDTGLPGGGIQEHIIRQGQSDWFKFRVRPGAKVILTLTNLPANYDLTVYKDIGAAYAALTGTPDLNQLGAEFAPDAFSPDAFSPDAFSPDAFSPDAFSPDAFSPDAFSPDAFSPDAFSPDAFSPDAFSPDAFSPDAYSPDAFSPDAFSPDAFSPDAFSPDAFSPDAFSAESVSPGAFSGAQTRSLVAVSAFGGTSGEGIARHTWDNDGYFYARVRGRNGAFSLAAPFKLQVVYLEGTCGLVHPITTGSTAAVTASGKKTIVLTDLARMTGDTGTLQQRLATFVGRPEVDGVVVDVATDARVNAANVQAAAHLDCPYAKNLVGNEIKRLVDSYRRNAAGAVVNPLEYVVITGGDGVIPFFRLPDQAGLANEKDFVPPVLDSTASQASLKLGYVLSQDRYGSAVDISINDHVFSLPDLAVGRLVETPADAVVMLEAYLGTPDGVVVPRSALVTGYDFLADAAEAVRADLKDALGAEPDTLIEAGNLPPTDPTAWSASQLGTALLGQRHDITFLAGHFSASSALAADYTTRLRTTDLLASATDFRNALIFSEGCHSGYNTVDQDAINGITPTPDWSQAFASRGATLVAGTGYQYGETEVIEYGERLYLEFSRQLHTGTGPIAVGKALVRAKRNYIAQTAQWRGIHEKTVVESTLWGLPMLRFDVPGARLMATTDASAVTGLAAVTQKPGVTLGLRTASLQITPQLVQHSVPLNDVSMRTPTAPRGELVAPAATYLAAVVGGRELTVANPAEPILPLDFRNVSASGLVLRGVGFRGGSYTDTEGIRPLTAAPATEVRGVRAPFVSDVFYPVRPWNVNYFDALSGGPGITRIALIPSQFRSSAANPQLGTRRTYSQMDFRLYYSSYTGAAALAASPAIDHVAGVPGTAGIHYTARVTGLPGSIQTVWVTYTTTGSGTRTWTSVDLVQNASDSSLWEVTVPLGAVASTDVRYIVQAANAMGLVTLDTNLGALYTPGPDTVEPEAPKLATVTELQTPPTTGVYREPVTLRARVSAGGVSLPGRSVVFGIGSERRRATTGADGIAETRLSLFQTPGAFELRASVDENSTHLASSDARSFAIGKRATTLSLAPGCGPVEAILRDASAITRTLRDQAVLLEIGTQRSIEITDFGGRALPGGTFAQGTYPVSAVYGKSSGNVFLDDERYEGSDAGVTSPVSLVVGPADVTTAYTGTTLVQTVTPMSLSARVTTGRSLAGAIVCFRLRDLTGLAAAAATGTVGVDGVARATVLAPAVGIYTIEATANGGSEAAGFWSATMASALVAVFDPSASVTGGGFVLTSATSRGLPPTGAKAHYGFNAKFGANNVPKGNLEFKVNEIKLNVKATTIEWMVINGAVATFQGAATVNGTAGYTFRVIASDASPNTFEIRVWNSAGSIDNPNYLVSGSTAGGNVQVR
jgi:hypothetical protein